MLPTKKDVRITETHASAYVASLSIRVLVGAEESGMKEFTVHEDLICPRSHFFRKAMSGPWKESEERKVDLPEDEPGVFALYLKLIYTNTLPVKQACSALEAGVAIGREYVSLSKLYVLAKKLMDDEARDTVLAAMASRSVEEGYDGQLYFPPDYLARTIYDGTVEGDPARKLLVDLYTQFGTENSIAPVEELPKDFLYDMTRSLLGQRPLPQTYASVQTEVATLKSKLATKTKEAVRKDDTISALRDSVVGLEEELKDTESDRDKYMSQWNTMDNIKWMAEFKATITEAQVADLKRKVERMQPYVPRHLH